MLLLTVSASRAETQKLAQADAAKIREERLLKSLLDAPQVFQATSRAAAGLPRVQRWAMTFEELDRLHDLPKGTCLTDVPMLAKQLLEKPDTPATARVCGLFVTGDFKKVEDLAAKQAKTTVDRQELYQGWRLACYAAAEQGETKLACTYLARGLKKAVDHQALDPWCEMQEELISLLRQMNERPSLLAAVRDMHNNLTSDLGAGHARTLKWQNILANTYYELNNPVEAEKVFGSLLAILHEEPKKNEAQIKVIRGSLAKAITAQGRKADGKAMSFAIQQAASGQTKPKPAAATSQASPNIKGENTESLDQREALGIHYFGQRKHVEAVELFRVVLTGRRKLFGPEHSQTLDAQNNLGAALHELRQDQEAVALLREVVKLSEQLLPTDDLKTIERMNNLANALGGLREHAEALKLHRQVAEVRRQVLEPNHPKTIDAYNNVASNLDDVGQPVEAEKMQREVVESRQTVQGPEHLATLRSRQTLGSLMEINGKNREAEKEWRSIMASCERIFGKSHPETLAVRCALATVLMNLGEYQESKEQCQRALEGCQISLSDDNPIMLECKRLLARLSISSEYLTPGTSDTRKTLAIMLKRHGPEHEETLQARTMLAHQLQRQKDFAEAAEEYEAVISLCRKLGLLTTPTGLNARNGHANNQRHSGKLAEAEENYKALIKDYTSVEGADSENRLDCLGNYGLTLKDEKKFEEALSVLKEVLAKRSSLHGERYPKVISLYYNVGDALEELGRMEEARTYFRKAKEYGQDAGAPSIAAKAFEPPPGGFDRNSYLQVLRPFEGHMDAAPIIPGAFEAPKMPMSSGNEILDSLKGNSPMSSPLLAIPPRAD